MYRVLKDKRLFFLFLTALIFSLAKSTFATTYITPTDDQMVIGSRAIVRGRVLAVESAFDAQTGRVWTYTTLRINEVLKGQLSQRKIFIKEEGGQTAERGSIVFGTPQFKVNEPVFLYLDTWRDGSFRVHQMFLGKFNIYTDARSGEQFVARAPVDEGVVNLQSVEKQISTEITEKMELSAYLQMIRGKVAANVEQSRIFEEMYYSNVPKLMEPPEFPGLKQKGNVEPQWTYISGARPRWFEPDSNQPVVFQVNPAGAPNQQIMNDISAAMNAWSIVPGCSMRVANGGSTTECAPTDTLNTIVFNNCDGRWSGGGCQGILALGGLSWFPGQTRVINGVTFVRAVGGFISFNPFAACNFGNSCNVQEITTHELGHALGLGHSADVTATMYAIAHFDGRCASTRQDDRDGITFIYPGSGGGGGPLSITTSALANGTVGAAYTQTLTATGGTLPYTWTLVSGALPAGLTLSSTGTISGTPTTATTANFTVQVRDAAQATAQRAFSITTATAAAPYDSQFVSQTVPTSVQPGQVFTVNMKFLNTGSQPWATGTTFNFYLASQNPALNQTWGGNGVALFDYPTAPGQQLDLTFNVTAPTTAGTYNFQWQLYQNGGITFFGQMSQNVVIQVGSGGTQTNNAAFVSQTVPTSMTAGQSYSVSVTMQNTGTTTWSTSTYKLGSQNPQDNTTWGTNRVNLPSSVAPNTNATFTFNVTAPTTTGTYNFQWKMQQDGVGFFGAASTNVAITVSAAGGGTNGATFVSQSVPNTMTAGQTYPVIIQVQNTGTTTWSTTSYKLGSQNPQDNTTWGTNRVLLPAGIVPGGTATFNFNVQAPTTPGTYNFQWQMLQEGVGYFGAATTNVVVTTSSGSTCTVPIPPPPSNLPNDIVWMDDQVPAGAFFAGVWIWDPTRKMSGVQSNTEPATAGIHQHYFQNASQTLTIGQTDKLVCYVMLNPCDTPQELMLQWRDASGWEHRAYWGQNLIPWGTDGTQSRYYMGALPQAGQWTRLEVPATSVGMNGHVADGMAFTLYGGQAWFDRTGKDNTTGGGGCTVAVAPPASNLPSDTIWVDDNLPSGAIAEGIWNWDTAQKTSGTQSNTEPAQASIHQHYFYNGASLVLNQNDKLVCYVLLSTCDTPREVMLQWHDFSGWEHRAYWGQNVIPWGTDGTQSRYYMGALPQAGQWTRLEVPASLVGLSGRPIDGMAFTLSDGQAWFDRAGKDNGGGGGGGCTVPIAPPPSNLPNDFIWLDDQIPTGAFFDGIWNWDTTQKMSGTRSHTEPVQSGPYQHYFQDAVQKMSVGQTDMLVCYVLISPCDTPFELMLQWHDANGWEHRAYWGQNLIDWGVSGTQSRYYMGPLPQTGQWVRLEIPANAVGVNGRLVDGMAFTLYGGKAWFDRAGKTQ